MALDLQDDKFDFKDLNTSFLRRPAAVTIRKPFFTTAEMSDLLLRTLRNYVPPAHRTVSTGGGSARSLGLIRAVVITYERINEAKFLEVERQYPAAAQKIRVLSADYNQNQIGNANAEYIKPIKIAFDQNLCIRPLVSGESITAIYDPLRPDIINSHYLLGTTLGNPHYYSSEHKTEQSYPYGDLVAQRRVREIPNIGDCFERYARVYIFDSLDHTELQPEDTDNVRKKSQAPRHTAHDYFYNQVPSYISNPKLVTFYTPPAKKSSGSTSGKSTPATRGVGDTPQITDEFIKETFGAIPSKPIYAYKWDFAVPYGYEMHIVQESTLRTNYYKGTTQSYYDETRELTNLIRNIPSFQVNGIYIPTTGRRAANVTQNVTPAEQKSLTTKLDALEKASTLVEKLEAATSLQEDLGKLASKRRANPTEGVVFKAFRTLVSQTGETVPAVPEAKHAYDKVTEYIYRLSDGSLSVNGASDTESEAFFVKYGLPFFGFLYSFYKSRLQQREDTFRSLYTLDYVVAKNPVNMTELEFRIRYYAVLLLKILDKLDEYEYFINDNIIQIPTLSDITDCSKMLRSCVEGSVGSENGVANVGTEALAKMKSRGYDRKFVAQMDRVLFSSLAGMYITSMSDLNASVKAPMWNAEPTEEDFKVDSESILPSFDASKKNQDFLDALTKAITLCNNKDVENIGISRVVQGISTATVTIKNDKEKYNFNRDDGLNSCRICIEPMDQIDIFLPDFDGKLRPVFSGLISRAEASDDGGYHSINIDADCNMKYFQINRTNIKPSASRQESENNPLTAFTVPEKMFGSINNFLPLIFAQSLTYLECQPRALVSDTEMLFTETPVARQKKTKVNISNGGSVPRVGIKYDSFVSNMSVNETDVDTEKSTTKIEVQNGGTSTEKKTDITIVFTSKVEGEVEKSDVSDKDTTTSEDIYSKVIFADPLFNYLWYKSASHYPKDEAKLIDDNLEKVLNDYVYTSYTGMDNNDTAAAVRVLVPGAQEPTEALKNGKRCSYVIFKQRRKGTMSGIFRIPDEKNASLKRAQELSGMGEEEDRAIAAVIEGTSQPSFVLQGLGFSLQTSHWKTNMEVINDVADKFNFLCYTMNTGVVRFAPYNFDLMLLNTNQFNSPKIDTNAMLLHRYASNLNNDPNPLILKKKYLISYDKSEDETRIVNWLRLNGDWVIGGSNQLMQAVVINPVLIKKFGVRAAQNRTVIGIKNTDSLRLYGLSWLDRQNKRYRSATISGLYDSRMDVNCPYYVPHDNTIYFCESLNIRYTPGNTCTYSMGATYGKKPILELTDKMVGTIPYKNAASDRLFSGNIFITGSDAILEGLYTEFIEKNNISPTVYAQYKRLFGETKQDQRTADDVVSNIVSSVVNPIVSNSPLALTVDTDDKINRMTRNAALCCYNGYLWDNVSGISFEELIFNYGYFLGQAYLTGFTTTLSLAQDLEKPLFDYVKEYLDRVSGTGGYDEAEANALNLAYIYIPSIPSPNRLPDVFDHQSYLFTDLKVPGLVEPAQPQLVEE